MVRARKVRLGDVTISGRVRLDALARYLQDVAADDVDEVGAEGTWVLRRLALRSEVLPVLGERVELTTFCSGYGSRWAQRTTTIRGISGADVEAVALWIYLDDAGRPRPLPDWFLAVYGESVAGKLVGTRLRHRPPSEHARARAFPLRAVDFDVLGHLNNAASWAAVEEAIHGEAPGARLVSAEVEHREAVTPGCALSLLTATAADRLACWLVADGRVRSSAVVELAPPR